MSEKGSNKKGSVDEIQWRWARRMEGVNRMKRRDFSNNLRRSKRHEETYQQGKDIELNHSARKRLILSASHLTAEGFGRRLMIGGSR